MLFTVPNTLTWLRIFAIPIVVVLFYLPFPWSDPAAGAVFAIAAITDTLDGYYARKLGQTSRLGAFLDPVADKLIVAVALVLLVSRDPTLVVVLPAIVIIGREIAISALREWMAEIGKRTKVAVSPLGKIKTIVQMVGLSMMLIRWDVWFLPTYQVGVILTAIAAVLTLVSAIDYLRAAWPDLRGHA
ncbi:MAG: CDP-diacylglycerol--glycerol-3-phosphate 3-phosphatidyltransferase [Gammaproteobacteria bacterium]|nr:CDP-diacylglycerol--glycerol-3-phosphate 3-phosphatidyltransferase [Gammaproteobacteria bacterium]